MSKLKLDLHDIYNKSHLIDEALNNVIDEALDKKIKIVEIIPGKGSGQLKKKIIRFLRCYIFEPSLYFAMWVGFSKLTHSATATA